MKLSDMSIRRPVLASMLSLALVLFGAIGYSELAVREFPDVDPPIVSVSTALPGANPQVVESAVTDILEEELSTVQGLRTLTSSSAEQFSNITLEFTLDRPVEEAAQDVRDKVSRVRGRLPEDVEEPVVAKQEADAQPFMWLARSGANYDLLQLSDLADRVVDVLDEGIEPVGLREEDVGYDTQDETCPEPDQDPRRKRQAGPRPAMARRRHGRQPNPSPAASKASEAVRGFHFDAPTGIEAPSPA